MVGRKKEQEIIMDCLRSNRAEFLVVYGRRRIGKTFLIKEFFNYSFSFYATGLSNEKTRQQLKTFNGSLQEYGSDIKTIPEDWYEAFSRLKKLIQSDTVRRDPVSGKIVIFIDELPWLDTARSDFKSALEYFWNSYASTKNDLLLIVCGSATSWIIDNLIGDKGGFHNRITRKIHLLPFTLSECEELFKFNSVSLTRKQIIESYMIFGGIPYYINCFDRRLSLAQNVDELLFNETGQLYYECDQLLKSLFKHSDKHLAILEVISKNRCGVTRTELAKEKSIGDGEPLTKTLNELEQCGFIRKYKNYTKAKSGYFFQLIDPFILFSNRFLKNKQHTSWLNYINTPSYYAWTGNAFEIVSLIHISQIKKVLGIEGVETCEFSWRSKNSADGVQIDLLIDRKDGVINLCEMKYTIDQFEISYTYEKELNKKISTFVKETNCSKAIHLTVVSPLGLKENEYSGMVIRVINGEDLFCR